MKGLKRKDSYSSDEINSVITLDDILGKEVNNTEDMIIRESLQEMPRTVVENVSERKNKTQYIENPLPVPKRKEHKQMDFTIDLLNDNDDFDIIDMSGMDFFDIE